MKIYTFNDKVLTRNTKWLKESEGPTPPTPSLPPYTIRMRFTDGVTPEFSNGTLTQVSSSPNVWDLTYENNSWNALCASQSSLIEVIGANTTGVTDMSYLFHYCLYLTSIPLFNTSSVTNTEGMFNYCARLTSVPLFDTSNITNINSMLYECIKVESGALALYQQASSQVNPPNNHSETFFNCGRDTVTGAAELAQIPSDWGGTAS